MTSDQQAQIEQIEYHAGLLKVDLEAALSKESGQWRRDMLTDAIYHLENSVKFASNAITE